MPIRWQNVLRDALAIVLAISLIRAVAVGAEVSDEAVGALLFAVFVVGFCVAGCLTPVGRFAHLGLVALVAWLILAVYGSLTGAAESPGAYVSLLFRTAFGMLLGGAASLAIVRPGAKAARPPA